MANQKHLDILKQGAQIWNQWRYEHQDIHPDLSYAKLAEADLAGANLSNVDLSEANLMFVNLRNAEVIDADLDDADLRGANLRNANLRVANLRAANLSESNLYNTNLSEANLVFADLSRADLGSPDFSDAIVGWTIFGNIDMSAVKNLEKVRHEGPSTIGIDTIIRSQGRIPEIFLRNAGIPDSIIEAIPSLVGSLSPFDFYSCFISYSSKDQAFAERLHADLLSKGVRCWYAPHDMRIGDEIRPRIDESIRIHDKLLLVLSESSLASTWVKKEVETAFEQEAQQNKLVLFPIRLDETVMHTQEAWAADIRRMRHIGDFTRWKDHDEYQRVFERLLRDLKAQ